MPPKKKPPKKKPPQKKSKKGTKLSKSKKLRLQQEEAARKLREEEEARLQAERDERERLEREKKEEEIQRLELKDSERRDDELNELSRLLEKNYAEVTKWTIQTAETAKWERYMCCDGAPDPETLTDINTYISLFREDPDVNITSVLKKCDLSLRLTQELIGLFDGATEPAEAARYQESFVNLQELIHTKHLLTSEEILKTASANIDTATGNMRTVIQDDKLTLCLWANLKKNPRFKGLVFEEVGLGFELPKQLAVRDVAVRLLHTRYDHLSPLARMTHLSTCPPSRRSLTGEEENLPDDLPEAKEDEGAVEDVDAVQSRMEELLLQSPQESEKQKSTTSLRSFSLQSTDGQQSQIETQMEALSAEGDLLSSCEQLMSRTFEVRVVDLKQFSPLGGVFYYDVFHLPSQAQQVHGWEMRQFSDGGLQVCPYPTESTVDNTEVFSTVGVSVKLPDSVAFLEAPHVARWDAAGIQWRMDGITDIQYEESETTISFKMDSFQPFVLMQQTYANLPFRGWQLRPLGQDSALFTVHGALIQLSITIKDNCCMLQLEPELGFPQLEGKWMSGPALQDAMTEAGINIFVDEYTDKYVKTYRKDPLSEYAAYEQMALFASACAFSWSQWNSQCGNEDLVMQACEHLGPGPVPAASWRLYMLRAQRSQKLEISEGSDAYSSDHRPGSEFHSTFIHMLQDTMSPEGIARTRASHYLFVDTVQKLLCSTRLLMYA